MQPPGGSFTSHILAQQRGMADLRGKRGAFHPRPPNHPCDGRHKTHSFTPLSVFLFLFQRPTVRVRVAGTTSHGRKNYRLLSMWWSCGRLLLGLLIIPERSPPHCQKRTFTDRGCVERPRPKREKGGLFCMTSEFKGHNTVAALPILTSPFMNDPVIYLLPTTGWGPRAWCYIACQPAMALYGVARHSVSHPQLSFYSYMPASCLPPTTTGS